MKIETLRVKNFRCFGSEWQEIPLKAQMSTFVGGNGSGKTASFHALSRLFGIARAQRAVQRRDFHLPANAFELENESLLAIEVVFVFPELQGLDEAVYEDAVPEVFLQMAATAPGAPLKVRMQLRATWRDDGTPDGDVEEDIRWVRTLDSDFNWEDCVQVHSVDRGLIQLIYVPAVRDAASQVTNLLKGRLWQAARWSDDFRTRSSESAEYIQRLFEDEGPAKLVIEKLTARWQQLNEADTDTEPALRLVNSRLEELVRKVEFVFSPDEEGRERELADLSDGQRSLFHIALTAATLEVERSIFAQSIEESVFEHEKLRRVHLTLLAIEEPENSLSPFFLSRIVSQAREIGDMQTAQVMLSSHSPAILSRTEPEEVRFFRLNRHERQATVRKLTLPPEEDAAGGYVRLAVKAYPELYFARFVVLGEGDSERLVISRIADAMNVPLDPSFVPIVPLGGRFVEHFWRLLRDLEIPHATILDLDIGRRHGGTGVINKVASILEEQGVTQIDRGDLGPLTEENLLDEGNHWLGALREKNVFFSHPLDLDFAMLGKFPFVYQVPHSGGRGPRTDQQALNSKRQTTLKSGGNPALYDHTYDDLFCWYPYLFLGRSKPETHISALSRLSDEQLANESPRELRDLIETIRIELELPIEDT